MAGSNRPPAKTVGDAFSSGLNSLRNQVTERFRTLNLEPQERKMQELVDRATSDLLIGPDWSLNLEVVDIIGREPGLYSDKVLRCLRRTLNKNNVKVQLLTVTLLETCVKNSLTYFHDLLLQSDLWKDLLSVGDTPRRWDAEVRDRILCLLEDFGKGLPNKQFDEAYTRLLEHGVDFPVRLEVDEPTAGAVAPYYTPPAAAPTPLDALAGLSPDDRAAIQAAIAENEAQLQAEESLRLGQAGEALGPEGGAGQAAARHRASAGGAAAAAAGAAAAAAVPRRTPEDAMQVARNSSELLSEMLSTVPEGEPLAVTDPMIKELADQCYRSRTELQGLASGVADDEALLGSVLQLNDDMQRVLHKYEELSARAQALLPSQPPAPAGATAVPTSAAAFAQPGAGYPPTVVPAAPYGGAAAAEGAGPDPNFTLLGEDESEDEAAEVALQTRRGEARTATPTEPLTRPERRRAATPAAAAPDGLAVLQDGDGAAAGGTPKPNTDLLL